jgi:hypothetical protein
MSLFFIGKFYEILTFTLKYVIIYIENEREV